MTSIYESPVRIRRIGEEQTAADAMAGGPERDAAQLHVAVLVHVLACQTARDSGLSAVCSQIDATVNGTPNPDQPYLTWQCCEVHKKLRAERVAFTKRAAELGVEINFDVAQVIEA